MNKRVNEVMLKQACLRCGAYPGRWCVTKTGRRAAVLHADRFFASKDAGDLPLKDAR